jgi:hypothetical protein
MRYPEIVTLTFCALAACGDDVSLGARGGIAEGGIAEGGVADSGVAEGGVADGGVADGGVADGGGICMVEAGAALDMPCGNVSCNGESQYCSGSTWPDPCKPLPCVCAVAPPSAQSCACLLKYITPDCDAGATCTNTQSGLVIVCK